MDNVLIVVDMQNDFVYGNLGTPEAQAIVPNVVKLVQEANANRDMIIFTQDIHKPEDYIQTTECHYVPYHCISGTEGVCIIEELQPYIDRYVCKSTYGTNIWEIYRDIFEDARSITLCGVCTDICVISNALILRSMYPR